MLILTRSEVAALLDRPALLASLRAAFVALADGAAPRPLRVPVPLAGEAVPAGASGMLLAPGLVPGIPAYTVKVHAKYPGAEPAIQGIVILHDLATGRPLALLESSHLTAERTALAAALGADALARPDASCVAIIGAGAQGRAQLAALRMLRPIKTVRVLDAHPAAARAFVEAPVCAGLAAQVALSIEAALDGADIAVTATWAREPFMFRRHLHAGLHITTLGPDQPGKCEVAAEALRAARVIVDDRRLAVDMGAVGGAGLGADAIHAELGEVLAGRAEGRRGATDVTVFGAVGLPFQDLVAAWLVLGRAREAGIGREIALLA
jgi:ornithine cyclodeaminase